MNDEKAPYHIAQKVMLYFFDVFHERKKTMSDPLGQETLRMLVGTLTAINAPTLIWGNVADFVLKRATKGFAGLSIYYEAILCAIAPHVSAPKLAKIINHFASVGRLETLIKLTTTHLQRGPLRAEVLEVAKSHCNEHGGWTNPKDKIWGQLFDLAHPDDIPAIKKLYEKAQERQKISDDDIL